MIVLWILLGLLALLLITPVGVAAAFVNSVFSLAVKLGPARIQLLPKKPKAAEDASEENVSKEKVPKKEKKQKASSKPRQKLTKDDILGIVRLAMKALGRFCRGLRLDELLLHITAAADDPYDTVMQYGYINAALGAVLPLLHNAFQVKKEDVGVAMDFQREKMAVDAKLTATLRIGQILYIGFCAGCAFLLWLYRRKRRAKKENKIIVSEKGT